MADICNAENVQRLFVDSVRYLLQSQIKNPFTKQLKREQQRFQLWWASYQSSDSAQPDYMRIITADDIRGSYMKMNFIDLASQLRNIRDLGSATQHPFSEPTGAEVSNSCMLAVIPQTVQTGILPIQNQHYDSDDGDGYDDDPSDHPKAFDEVETRIICVRDLVDNLYSFSFTIQEVYERASHVELERRVEGTVQFARKIATRSGSLDITSHANSVKGPLHKEIITEGDVSPDNMILITKQVNRDARTRGPQNYNLADDHSTSVNQAAQLNHTDGKPRSAIDEISTPTFSDPESICCGNNLNVNSATEKLQNTPVREVLTPVIAIYLDHLPLPNAVDRSRTPRVPLRCSSVMIGVDFLQYPLYLNPPRVELLPDRMDDIQQRGLAIAGIGVPDLEIIFQEWLFFGLLQAILDDLGQTLSADVLSSHDSSRGTFLSTTKLYEAGRMWIDVVKGQLPSITDREERFETYLRYFRHVANCLNSIYEYSRRQYGIPSDRPLFSRLILLSISSVAELLARMVGHAFDDDRCSRMVFRSLWIDDEISTQMKFRGWCPTEIDLVKMKNIQPTVQFFLSEMSRPHGIGKHEDCVELFCHRSQVDMERYEPVHRVEDCHCAMVEVDAEDIRLALQQDAFPLVRVQADAPKRLEIAVVKEPSEEHITYLAVSHVWAEGLGNPRSNGIFKCQWEYLVKTLQEIKPRMVEAGIMDENGELCLFLDTLSIPIIGGTADEEAKRYKAKAISQMRHIYQKAVAVLVLDELLTACKYSTFGQFHDFEAIIRLYTSTWMRRLWTYQENVLAKRLWIQFSDRIVTVNGVTNSIRERLSAFSVYNLLSNSVMGVDTNLDSFRSMQDLGLMKVHPISLIWTDVWGRSTSRSEDEPICLATSLDLDVELVASQSPTSRVQCLWECIDRSSWGIPVEVIVHEGPRVAARGYHWAPLSMLRARGSARPINVKYSANRSRRGLLIKDLGLRVRLPGFRIAISPPRFRAPSRFEAILRPFSGGAIFVRSESGWYQASILYRLESTSTTATIAELMETNNPYALIIATEELVPFAGGVRAYHQIGAYGRYQHTEYAETDLLLLKTEYILDLWHLPPQRQMFLEAAYSASKAFLSDPSAGQPPSPVNGIIDLDHPENKEYLQRLWSAAKALVQIRITPESELTAAAKAMYPNHNGLVIDGLNGPQLCFMLVAFSIFYDMYAHVTEEFSKQQDWIVD